MRLDGLCPGSQGWQYVGVRGELAGSPGSRPHSPGYIKDWGEEEIWGGEERCLSTLYFITSLLSHQMISGAKDLVSSQMARTKDALSTGMASIVDTAKGVVQGGLGMTQSTLTVTKDAVASGATGAVGVAKGALQTGIDATKTVATGTKDAVSIQLFICSER